MNLAVPVRCLNFHAAYACENTGVCCASGWRIAVESSVEDALRSRLRSIPERRLPNGPDGFTPMEAPPKSCKSSFRLGPSGSCWFRDERDHRCSIHRELGEPMLPSACRQFPRVCVLEPASVTMSLSHYCPTAAALLFAPWAPVEVVEPWELRERAGTLEGLDTRGSYPPFLRRDVLLGLDGLRALEDGAMQELSTSESVFVAMNRIASAVETIRCWAPSRGPIYEAVGRAFGEARAAARVSSDPRSVLESSLPVGVAPGSLPDPSQSTPITPTPQADRALRRYVAARLMAAWPAYFAEDIRTLGSYLGFCLDTVLFFASAQPPGVEGNERWKQAIRQADLWILHLCDPERLTRNLR